jgi:hypothetical protein
MMSLLPIFILREASNRVVLSHSINELSLRLHEALHQNNLTGISLGPRAPPIHSLLFADDLILCGKATQEEANKIRGILYTFLSPLWSDP